VRDPGTGRAEAARGATIAIPFAVAVGLFGVSFGVLSQSPASLDALAAVVMSVTTFAGSAQFAALSILQAGGSAIAAILAAVLLNLRYLPIGLSVGPAIRGGLLSRFATAQLVVDESWAISSRGDGTFSAARLVGAGTVLWLSWVLGTIVGVVGGEVLGDPALFGLDAAFPALFLALLWPQLRGRRAGPAALLGAAIALVLLPFTPAGVPIIAAAGAALLGWRRQ
jgi:4-azaleucine resistance transporter AzlC